MSAERATRVKPAKAVVVDVELMASLKKEAALRGVSVQRIAAEHLDRILQEQLRRYLMKQAVPGMIQ